MLGKLEPTTLSITLVHQTIAPYIRKNRDVAQLNILLLVRSSILLLVDCLR